MNAQSGTSATAISILEATLQVIAQKGIRAATTRAIAQAAGVHEVTLFRNFGSKTNLIKVALAHRASALERDAAYYTGDLEADLVRLTENYRATLEAFSPALGALLAEVNTEPELGVISDALRQMLSAIAELIGRYQQEGKLRPEPPESVVPAFLGPVTLPYVMPASPLEGMADAFDARTHVNRFLYGRAER